MYIYSDADFLEIEHTADTGIRARGNSLEALFASAAFGFYHILYEHKIASGTTERTVRLAEETQEELLVSWLSELNYLHTVGQFFTSQINELRIHKSDKIDLEAELCGSESVIPKTEIKAVTYHKLQIQKHSGIFEAQIFFDI